jgi:hypothetical protein
MVRRGESNIYDLVEKAAAKRGIPNVDLWQDVARALVEKTLKTTQDDLSLPLDPRVPGISLLSWLVGFRAAVDRYNDPRSMAHILKNIFVPKPDFERWLRNSHDRRGPRPGTTGYQEADRKLFDRMSRLLQSGEATSPYRAALLLDQTGKLKGGGTPESRAKRVSSLFRKEHGRP